MATGTIRPVRGDDLDSIYDICLRTADAGGDATSLHDDPLLPGHVWAAPYVVYEPEHGFVFVDAVDRPIGYVLGAIDSRAFETRLEREWWPPLRRRYPLDAERRAADQATVWFIHEPPTTAADLVVEYPSHLHVDLLPAAQGQGVGRRLVETLLGSLTADGSTGVHLGVDEGNEQAMGFYAAIGFDCASRDEHGAVFTKRLG